MIGHQCISLYGNYPTDEWNDPGANKIRTEEANRNWRGTVGHIIYDGRERKLVGVGGTLLISLEQKTFLDADRIDARELIRRLEQYGSNDLPLGKPVSVVADDDQSRHQFDAMVGVLTITGNVFVMQIIETRYNMLDLKVRVRPHQQHPKSHLPGRRRTALVTQRFPDFHPKWNTAAQYTTIRIDAGENDGVKPDTTLNIVRRGVSGSIETIAEAEITRVLGRDLCEARVIREPADDQPVRRGDLVQLMVR